jgi:hypothetical protein
MKSIILKQHEVVHLRDTGSVILWRAVRCQPHPDCGVIRCRTFNPTIIGRDGEMRPGPDTFGAYSEDGEWGCKCHHGRSGEERWVKEAFRIFDSSFECACYDDCQCSKGHGKPVYRADCDNSEAKWISPIHMKEAQSRFTVTLDIDCKQMSDEDAKAVCSGGILNGIAIMKAARSWDLNSYFWKITATLKT